ncbi:MAG: hypothetical protein ACOYOB_16140 [Myxococcota bacterium]
MLVATHPLFRRPATLCAVLSLLALATWGCGDVASPALQGSDVVGGDTDVTDEVAGACTTDQDCLADGLVCDVESGACVQCRAATDCPGETDQCVSSTCLTRTACKSDKQCLDQGFVCDDKAGFCVACLTDADCGELLCKANQCVAPPPSCVSSKDCKPFNQVCNKTAGYCVDCNSDVDCASSAFCSSGVCAPDVCKADEHACPSANVSAVCTANGSNFIETQCVQGEVCDLGSCWKVVCTPGDVWCLAGNVAQCNKLGTDNFQKEICGSESVCKAGKCQMKLCEPGVSQCAGATVRTCDAEGLAWTYKACAPASSGKPAEVCVVGTLGPTCAVPACTAGQSFCAGTLAYSCSNDGMQTTLVGDCSKPAADGKPQLCMNGQCVAQKCTPGSQTCADGQTLAKCKVDGTGYDNTPCGGNMGCEVDQCKAAVCTPGATLCSGTVVELCNGSGTGKTPVKDCKTSSQACKDGGCVDFVCPAGAVACQGGKKAACSADGMAWTMTDCPTGETCSAGACKLLICKPSQLSCDGNSVVKCDSTGTTQQVLEKCGDTGKTCMSGVCVK